MVSPAVSKTLRYLAGIQDDEEPKEPGLLDSLGQGIQGIGSGISQGISDAGSAIGQGVRDVGTGISSAVSSAASAVSDAYAVPQEQRPPQYSGPSYAQAARGTPQPAQEAISDAVSGAPGALYDALEPARTAAAALDGPADQPGSVLHAVQTPITPPERAKPLVGPFDLSNTDAFPDQESRNRFQRAQGGLSADVADIPYQAAEAMRQSVEDAASSFADAIRAGSEGRPLAAAGNTLWSAVQVAGLPWSVAARTINEMLPEARIGPIGPGDVATSLDLIPLALKGVNGLKNVGQRALSPQGLAAIHDAPGAAVGTLGRGVAGAADAIDTGISAGRSALAGNAERMAAADARMAEQGSTAAPGVFGLSGIEPGRPEVQGMRPPAVELPPLYPGGTPEGAVNDLMRASAPAGSGRLAQASGDEIAGLPASPFSPTRKLETADPARKGSGKMPIPVNPGGLPSVDEVRQSVDASLAHKDWYFQIAERAAQLVGADNLPEFFTIFGITSAQTKVHDNIAATAQVMRSVRELRAAGKTWPEIKASLLDMGDQIQSTYKKDGVTKEGVPYKKGDGRVDNKGEAVREYTRRPDIPFVLASNDKRQAIVDAYETAVSRVESGAKTSSYSGSFESAGQRVYDPRTTNDLWVFRGFNLTPKGVSNAANDDEAYRVVEAVLNEIAAEKGLPGHNVQASMWATFKNLWEQAPDLVSDYERGTKSLSQVLQEASERVVDVDGVQHNLFDVPTGQAQDFDRPEVRKVLEGVDPALMRSPGPERAAEMTRQYSGQGEMPRPSNLPFRLQERAVAEGRAPTATLPITADELDAVGLDREQGIFPWLTVPHRVSESGGHAVVHLPGGTSETAQYVGAAIGDAVGRPVTVSAPKHGAPNVAAVTVRAAPEQIATLAAELEAAGLPHAVGTTRGVLQIPDLGADPEALAGILPQALARSGIDPSSAVALVGDVTHAAADEHRGILEAYGHTYGSQRPPGLPGGAAGDPGRAPVPGAAAAPAAPDRGPGTLGVFGALPEPGGAQSPLSAARQALRDAQAGGDPQAIAAARQQLGAAVDAASAPATGASGRGLETPTQTLDVQGRRLTVEATGNPAAPFVLRGQRGEPLTLVPTGAEGGRRYFIQTPDGQVNAGTVGQLSDGSLLHLPTSGPRAASANRIWRADLEAQGQGTLAHVAAGAPPRAAGRGVYPDPSASLGMGASRGDPLAAVNRVLGQGVFSGVSGTTGGLVNQEMNPDDPYAFAKGFGTAALLPPLAQRGARGLARLAGARGADVAGGARIALGDVPPSKVRQPGLPGMEPAPPRPIGEELADLPTPGMMPSLPSVQKSLTAAEERAANMAARGITAPSAWDWIKQAGYSGIFGPATLVGNVTAGVVDTGLAQVKEATRALTMRQGGRYGAQAKAQLQAVPEALEGLKAIALGQGGSAGAAARSGGSQGTANLSERVVNPVAHVAARLMEKPGEILAEAPDAVFRPIFNAQGMRREADTIAHELGHRGQQAAQTAEQLLADAQAARANPNQPLVSGEARRIVDAGKAYADEMGYKGDPGGLARWIGGLSKRDDAAGVAASFLFPFSKTPGNIAIAAARSTPGIGLLPGVRQGRPIKSFDVIYDQAFGTLAASGLAAYAASGGITGSGPAAKPERDAMVAQGWQPRSTLVAGHYIPNRAFGKLQPMLDAIGESHDALAYRKPDQSASAFATDAVKRLGAIATDQVGLSGLADVFDLIDGFGAQAPGLVGRSITRYTPFGGVIRAAAQMVDPNARKPETWDQASFSEATRQQVEQSIPGLRGDVPAAQDVLGRDAPNPQQGWGALIPKTTTVRGDPAIRLFTDAEMTVPAPHDTITVGKVTGMPLTPAEQRRWNTLRGQVLIENADAYLSEPEFMGLEPKLKQTSLQKFLDSAAKAADQLLLSEMDEDDLTRRATDTAMKKAS